MARFVLQPDYDHDRYNEAVALCGELGGMSRKTCYGIEEAAIVRGILPESWLEHPLVFECKEAKFVETNGKLRTRWPLDTFAFAGMCADIPGILAAEALPLPTRFPVVKEPFHWLYGDSRSFQVTHTTTVTRFVELYVTDRDREAVECLIQPGTSHPSLPAIRNILLADQILGRPECGAYTSPTIPWDAGVLKLGYLPFNEGIVFPTPLSMRNDLGWLYR